MGIGLTSVWPSYVKSLFFDSDWGAKVFFMPRRRWLVPAPTRRIQIGSKMAPKVIMIFFLSCCSWAYTRQLFQLPLWKEKVRAPQKTKSWIKVGKLFEKLGRYLNRNALPDPHLLFREGVHKNVSFLFHFWLQSRSLLFTTW